jgi:hypothetical protein
MAKHQIMKINQEVYIYKINQQMDVEDLLQVEAPMSLRKLKPKIMKMSLITSARVLSVSRTKRLFHKILQLIVVI